MLLCHSRARLARAVAALATSAVAVVLLAVPSPAAAATAPFGPDVSRWQHPGGAAIDWARVRAGGSSFAIVKATEGASYTSPWFAADTRAARASGLAVGAYHFARPALPVTTAAAQARRFASVLGDVRTAGTLAPILDLESSGGLTPAQLVTWAQLFTETLRTATGRTPVVYTYPSFWSVQMAGTRALTRSPLWLAAYRATPPAPVGGWPAWSIWQYSATSRVAGVVGDVDMSRFADQATFEAAVDGVTPTSWTVQAPAAPYAVTATGTVRSASVRWMPADDGGALPTAWTVTASPGGASVTVPGTATTAVVPGLREGVRHVVTVRATNVAGSSPESWPSASTLVRGEAPAAPSTPTASVGRGTVTLRWPAVTGATGYAVLRCSPAPCSPTSTTRTTSATSTVDTAVLGGVPYAYAVRATNTWGSSRATAAVPAMPLPTVDRLDQPVGVVATGAANALTVAWRSVPFAARYQVLRCAGPRCVPGGTPVATVDIPVARLTQQVPAGSTFTYAVRAVAGPLASVASRSATGTALVPQRLRVGVSSSKVRAGQAVTVTVRVLRSDTGTALAGRHVTVSVLPSRGAAPRPLDLVTSATGVVSTVLHPQVTTAVVVRSAAAGLVAASARGGVAVTPVLGAVLSATTVPRSGTVTLSGRTGPLLAGELVQRQVLVKAVWRTVATVRVATGGGYAFVVKAPAAAGAQVMRVHVGTTARHLGNSSGQVRLTVR